MKLIIDTRENGLIGILKQNPTIQYSIQSLDVGDIWITKDDGTTPVIIIERKSIQDLLASIKDGRYDEQATRLGPFVESGIPVYYIIEGRVDPFSRQILHSAMFSLSYYKGFDLLRSDDIHDTEYVLCNILKKLEYDTSKGRVPFSIGKYEAEPSMSLLATKRRNSTITPENFTQLVLCNIPGISDNIAKAIVLVYPVLTTLISALQDDENALSGVIVGKRKIGAKTSQKVKSFLTG